MDTLLASDRDRILRAMAESCAATGYRGTTVRGVTERAGVDVERFDALFAGKEDCALAAFNKFVSETLARLSISASDHPQGDGLNRDQVQAVLELVATLPAFAQLTCVEARHGGTARLRAAYDSAARVLALMMERLGNGDAGAGVSALQARATLGALEALVRRELVAGRAARLPRLLPDFVYAALVPFVGQREALRQARQAARVVLEEGS